MPQPLSRVASKATVFLGNVGDYPLRRHPDLAMLVAEVIVSWGNVESFMLSLFVDLMGGRAELAADVYLALETQTAKTQAINAAAARLTADNQSLLRALLNIMKTNQKARDKIAHWTWGDSPNLTDALLLADPKVRTASGDIDPDRVYVYREPDFTEIITANERLAGFGLRFRWIIRGHPANREGRLYAELCVEPEIRERLDRQASRDQSPPSGSQAPPPPDIGVE